MVFPEWEVMAAAFRPSERAGKAVPPAKVAQVSETEARKAVATALKNGRALSAFEPFGRDAERCAAGCGRYLGYIADEMNMGLHELGPLAMKLDRPARINSTTWPRAVRLPINSAVRSATAPAAASRTASAVCTYRDVIERPLCPTSAAIVGSL